MTDDLVTRLLDIAGDTNEENETLHEAADRIKKLETALREVAKINNSRDRFSADIDTIIINALGEMK